MLLSPLLLLSKTNRRMGVCDRGNGVTWIAQFSLVFHLFFGSYLTWFSLKLPLNSPFDFADISTWCFLCAMTHCLAETLQLCWFCIRRKYRQHASSTENTLGCMPSWGLRNQCWQLTRVRINTVQASRRRDNLIILLLGLFVFTPGCLCNSLQIHICKYILT